jgi:hypothetical protein
MPAAAIHDFDRLHAPGVERVEEHDAVGDHADAVHQQSAVRVRLVHYDCLWIANGFRRRIIRAIHLLNGIGIAVAVKVRELGRRVVGQVAGMYY